MKQQRHENKDNTHKLWLRGKNVQTSCDTVAHHAEKIGLYIVVLIKVAWDTGECAGDMWHVGANG